MSGIPATQTVATVQELGQEVLISASHPVVDPGSFKPNECLLRMICSGVCHTDLHAALGDWPVKPVLPLIGGHEGVGEVLAIGEHTVDSPICVGQRVGVKWVADCCRNCEACRKGLEQYCEKKMMSGYTVNGTFCQYLVSYVHAVTPIPDGLDSYAAAPILCAGVTVYKALKDCSLNAGDWIVIPGAGGGLGHLAVQYAKYMGLRVIAVDGGDQKKKLCIEELGADGWVDYMTAEDLVGEIKKKTGGKGAHGCLVTAASTSAFTQAIGYLRYTGRLMLVGVPADPTFDVPVFSTVFKSISIQGSLAGNRQDAIEAMEIAATGKVKSYYRKMKLSEIGQVYKDMIDGKIAGRIVLDVWA